MRWMIGGCVELKYAGVQHNPELWATLLIACAIFDTGDAVTIPRSAAAQSIRTSSLMTARNK